MLDDFKLKIDDFGSIKSANMDISKVNIIAGKNSSGKTTISKIIYSIITTFSKDGEYLTYSSMKNQLISFLIEILNQENFELVDKINGLYDSLNNNTNYSINFIKQCHIDLESILNSSDLENKEFFLKKIDNFKKTIKSIESQGFYHYLLSNLLKSEFAGNEQILNNYSDGKIEFCSYSNNPFDYSINFKNDIKISSDNEIKNIMTNREVIYIETPYFFDFKFQKTIFEQKPYHQILLNDKLTNQSVKNDILDEMYNNNIINFQNKINKLIGGKFVFDSQGLVKFKQNNKTFKLTNTSNGIKSIGLIQLLLENRKLKENSYLIMDEPEVHLHPEWQVRLAEILILLVKDLNVNLFINSHSPHFIEAIEVFSTKYGLKNETKFYLTKKDKNTDKYNVESISFRNIYEIYDDLGDAYDEIDIVRGENLANHL